MRVTGSQREDLRNIMSQQLDPNDEAVQDALETVITLQESGTLDDLAAAADVVSLVSEAVDEDMVQSTTRALVHAGELFDSAAGEPEAVRNLELLTAAVSDPAEPPDPVGPIGATRKLTDPKVKGGLGFLLTLLEELGGQIDTRARRYDVDTEIAKQRT